jgi:hypothetical protein
MAWRASLLLVPVAALAAAGCGSSDRKDGVLTVHVTGNPARGAAPGCIFMIRNRLREGGRQRTCLTDVDSFPSPGATMHSRGRMTFALADGTIRAQVRITQRFRGDGVHASQRAVGTIVGGTGRYRGEAGSLRGGGTVADREDGLGPVRLRYRLTLRR